MISQLTGRVIEKYASTIVLEVAGVGYEIELTLGMMFKLPAGDSLVTIPTHFVVREDAQLLFGFQDVAERSLFRQLIRVSGIGPKVAIGMLSSISPNELVKAVRSSNSLTLTQIPGIGKKTAERLIVELKDKLNDWVGESSTASNLPESMDDVRVKEAEAALIALGYKAMEAAKLISHAQSVIVKSGTDYSVQDIIKQSLKPGTE